MAGRRVGKAHEKCRNTNLLKGRLHPEGDWGGIGGREKHTKFYAIKGRVKEKERWEVPGTEEQWWGEVKDLLGERAMERLFLSPPLDSATPEKGGRKDQRRLKREVTN